MRHRTIPEDSEFGYLPFTPSLLLPLQDTTTSSMVLWSKRHDILFKQEHTTRSQGFVHLVQWKFPSWKWRLGNHKRTARNSGGHLHVATVKSGFEGLVSALSIWRGSLLSFYFVLFCFYKEVCQCLSKRNLQMGASHWTPHSSTATGVRHSLSF